MYFVVKGCTRLEIKSTLVEKIKERQTIDEFCKRIREQMVEGKETEFKDVEGVLMFRDRWCVPAEVKLREKILREAHETPYTAYLRGLKMY